MKKKVYVWVQHIAYVRLLIYLGTVETPCGNLKGMIPLSLISCERGPADMRRSRY